MGTSSAETGSGLDKNGSDRSAQRLLAETMERATPMAAQVTARCALGVQQRDIVSKMHRPELVLILRKEGTQSVEPREMERMRCDSLSGPVVIFQQLEAVHHDDE